MMNLKQIADEADMIVNGYAYKKQGDTIRVHNLNALQRVLILDGDGKMLETNMEDIEIGIVERIYRDNKAFMEC